MIRLACFAMFVGIVASQGNNMMQYMIMNQMMEGGRGGGAGAGGMGFGFGAGGMGGMAGMAAMMAGSGGGGGGGGGGQFGSMMGAMMNNPMMLCKQTDNFQPIPCRSSPQMCQLQSFRAYSMPNILTCSPMGIGCCIKDAMTLMLVNRMG